MDIFIISIPPSVCPRLPLPFSLCIFLQHLVIESHNLDSTVTVNLTEEEIQSNFPGELEPVMKKPLSALLAKVFKVFTHPFKQVTLHKL